MEKLGIISGGGGLPCDVARAAAADNRPVHLIGIEGEAEQQISEFPHSWVKWGEIGRLFSILREENCVDVVIIGHVKRPDLSQVRMDLGALKLLPFIMKLKTGGDNSILSKIAGLFEDKGHRVCSVLDLVPSLAADLGEMSNSKPGASDHDDIGKGLEVVAAMGRFDVGQAVVVVNSHVIAVEGAEGTDQMLERCQSLRQWGRKGRHGVLVKAPKPSQDRRIDLPTIGPKTVELALAANLAGIAIAAGETLIADKSAMMEAANKGKLFVRGVNITGDLS
ncbi:MAG: LpxI family protein [bacterium]|nr:LpxI family protein [bacterium]